MTRCYIQDAAISSVSWGLPGAEIPACEADAGDSAIAKAGPARIATQGQFERAIFLRGVNTLKAARLVAESGHWEVASACARQIYELVLNMEAIDRAPDRERTSVTFVAFGLLQKLLFEKAELEYERDTGRPYSADRIEEVQGILDSPHVRGVQNHGPCQGGRPVGDIVDQNERLAASQGILERDAGAAVQQPLQEVVD